MMCKAFPFRVNGATGPVLLMLLAGCALIAGCGGHSSSIAGAGGSSSPTDGGITNHIYTNRFFGFSIPVPQGWSIASQETSQQLSNVARKLVAGDNQHMQAVMDESKKRGFRLLMMSEHPIGAPVPFNPSVIITAEQIPPLSGIQTGNDYLLRVRQLLEHSAMQWRPEGSPTQVTLGGKSFYRLDGAANVMGRDVEQSYFAVTENGYSLCFITSAGSKDQLARTDNVVRKVSFVE